MSTNTALQTEPRDPVMAFLERRLASPLLGEALFEPLCDFFARPGKQLRARLVHVAWQLAGGQGAPPAELPLALELLHAGSLIVDDIEDAAIERRGAPALHRTVGLPVALNAGNWLYFAALELIAELPHAHRALPLANALLARCHEGQALDVSLRVDKLPQGEVSAAVRALTERKTGGLAALATSLAAICAGAPVAVERALNDFGCALGVGLQMLDDTTSISCAGRAEKAREDLRNRRATWAWAVLAERLDARAYTALVRRPVLRRMRAALGDAGAQLAHRELQGALLRLGSPQPARDLVAALEKSYA